MKSTYYPGKLLRKLTMEHKYLMAGMSKGDQAIEKEVTFISCTYSLRSLTEFKNDVSNFNK